MDRLYTVGHGTLSESAFTKLLKGIGIRQLVDIRAKPGSTRNPQFNKQEMEQWLPAQGVAYTWEPRLGGFRSPAFDSPNIGLEEPAFRGFADHMLTAEFKEAANIPLHRTTAVMCSEGSWKNCHRRLLSDWFALIGSTEVLHIAHNDTIEKHRPLDDPRIKDNQIVYDRGSLRLF
jgi:uncharacterized protein (DUF488 family)